MPGLSAARPASGGRARPDFRRSAGAPEDVAAL